MVSVGFSNGEGASVSFDAVEKIAGPAAVTKVEGPFDSEGNLVKYISRKHSYYYLASFDCNATEVERDNLVWASSRNEEKAEKAEEVKKGGQITNGKIKHSFEVSGEVDSFSIYAYTNGKASDSIKTSAVFKQAIVFFIGGAGDARPYLMVPATFIMRDVMEAFNWNNKRAGYYSHFLGFHVLYPGIKRSLLNNIPNKEGTHISIVGHSFGGWNAAHVSRKLTEKGYEVDLLVTLDPAGRNMRVVEITDLYPSKPRPQCSQWINIYTDPDKNRIDDTIANVGGQWRPDPDQEGLTSVTVNCHHGEAWTMFTQKIIENNSAADILKNTIDGYLDAE